MDNLNEMMQKVKYVLPRIAITFLTMAMVSAISANWRILFGSKPWNEFVLVSNPKNIIPWLVLSVIVGLVSWRLRHIENSYKSFQNRS